MIQRVTFGHHFDSHRSLVPDDFPASRPRRRCFSRSSRRCRRRAPSRIVQYELFTPRYAIYRDLNTFDLRENVQLGPER